MAFEDLYKDAPAAGDVHVPGPGGPGAQRPARSSADIDDERRAQDHSGGYVVPGGLAVKGAFSSFFKVSGVSEELGLVFGWGIVCKDWDQTTNTRGDYFDVQKNHIPERAMVEATTEFMKHSRMAGEQHSRMGAGSIVHSFPLTDEIWKAMFSGADGKLMPGLPAEPPKNGWMVACAPDRAMLGKFKSGELTGFSIGGAYIEIDGRPVS